MLSLVRTDPRVVVTQEPPHKFATRTDKVLPGEAEMAAFPADAFDAKGQLKAEFIETEVKRVFPEGHSLWDKLQCSGNPWHLLFTCFVSYLLKMTN